MLGNLIKGRAQFKYWGYRRERNEITAAQTSSFAGKGMLTRTKRDSHEKWEGRMNSAMPAQNCALTRGPRDGSTKTGGRG